MKAEDFFYKCGVETRTPWFPPDPEFLNAWRDEFFQTTDISGYTFWICGAALEGWKTTDIDILVTGEIGDYKKLENIMTNAMQIGFKHRQLIDIAWNDYYKKFLEKGRCDRRAICCEYFYNHGCCTVEKCAALVEDIEAIVVGNEVIKNGVIITAGDPDAIKLGKDLWKIKISSPSPKQIQRILSGWVYKSSPIIITADIDFKQIIPWP